MVAKIVVKKLLKSCDKIVKKWSKSCQKVVKSCQKVAKSCQKEGGEEGDLKLLDQVRPCRTC
jgi:hypothetical protein